MKIIHTFSSQKFRKISTIDVALWHACCLCYLSLGYKLKLYCTKKDIPFLRRNKLLQYYEEIDIGAFEISFSDSSLLSHIDQDNFWFLRKLVAIYTEFQVNKEPFIYSDTDLFILKEIDISDCDCLFWTNEKRDRPVSEKEFYCDWKYFSTPKDYVMPEYIKNTDNSNYNMGLVYFKDPELFTQYMCHVFDFTVDNPCEFTNDFLIQKFKESNQNISKIWSMNAEQRIMTGFVKEKNLKVKVFDESGLDNTGCGEAGAHYFIIRDVWNQLKHVEHLPLKALDVVFALQKLIEFKNFFFTNLRENNLTEQLEFFQKKKQFKYIENLEKLIDNTIHELNN